MYIAGGIYTPNALNSMGLVKATCEYVMHIQAHKEQAHISYYSAPLTSPELCVMSCNGKLLIIYTTYFNMLKKCFFFEELCNI